MQQTLLQIQTTLSEMRRNTLFGGLHWKAAIPPSLETARQRPHSLNPHLFKLKRRTGAGGLIGSGAVENDLLIARNFMRSRT